MPEPADLAVDDTGLALPAGAAAGTTYDLVLNGDHVWSFEPGRDAESGRVPWPKALRPHLAGLAEVQVREHVSGQVLARADHAFDGVTDRRVSVRDGDGRALFLDKWGRLTRPLSEDDRGLVDELLDEVGRLLAALRDVAGVPAFLAYGTLLGAVRDGRLISHDNDVDVAYLSSHESPADVARESFRVQRALVDAGWTVRRGSGVRLNVRLRLADGSMRFVDVFTGHRSGDKLLVARDIGADIRRDQVLPLRDVDLMGHPMPVPAEPEAMLAAAYGPGWRVPDPSFKYETPRWLDRRFGGWYGGLMMSRKHWDGFWNRKPPAGLPTESAFASWVAEHYPSERPLLDVGCGTGKDTVFLARTGRRVTGIDYSVNAVTRARRHARAEGVDASFEVVNLYDVRSALALGAWLARDPEPCDVYVRFTLHALTDRGRANLWRLVAMSLRRGGRLFVEFRTPRDRRRHHEFGRHFRRYLPPDLVAEEIAAAGGRVVHREQGTGRAVVGKEDAFVCRMVAEWGDPDSSRPQDDASREAVAVAG
jgi:SAM-dependent methyltransferase